MNKRKSTGNKLLEIFIVLGTILIVLGPLYWMIVTSFKTEGEIYQIPPSLTPINATLENYLYALKETKIPLYFMNSIIYAVLTLGVVMVCVCLAAYAISRFRFRGKRGYMIFILISQLMPLTTLIVPLYISFGAMNLLNSRLAIVAVYSAVQIPIAIWLLLGYFNGIPREIDEAAIIDGCTHFKVLTKIIVPLAKPGLMAMSLNTVIFVWQELMLAMTFTNVDKMRPMMAGISSAITKSGVKWGQMNAVGIIAIIPMLIIYIFCQKYLIEGLTGGAVKG
ncbi:carbohydrate ABC transporter permease [uncultured Robinsoniella sp.]|uniref:carbohydrate ABC transporter permease n=1 Tax=uncultured Robinsoniella sp. TaxID=904190 RepID=UPI00374E3368